jgi:hypothetical protein
VLKGALLLCLGIAGAFSMGGCASSSEPVASSSEATATTLDPGRLSALEQSFDKFASEQSSADSFSVQYVVTTEERAEMALYGETSELSGSTSSNLSGQIGMNQVVAFVAVGHFSATYAKVPPGSKTPTGTVLTQVVVAASGAVADWGVSDSEPNLATLGTPGQLGRVTS